MSKIDWSIGTRLTKRKKKAIQSLFTVAPYKDANIADIAAIAAFLKDKWKL
jgi:hypothetical protein